MNLEKVNFGDKLNYKLTFPYMNNLKAHWAGHIDYKEDIFDCDMCTVV